MTDVVLTFFTTSPANRRFEDYTVGAMYDCGSVTVTEDAIIAFARQYDPQDMHIDRSLAAAGPFGEIIASGWYTVALMMRLLVDNFLPANGLAAPGIDELRWPQPVRPGDTLNLHVTVERARLSRSKPDRGLVHSFLEAVNQRGEVVMTMKPMNFVRCREPGP
jgi:acyl dehydratase